MRRHFLQLSAIAPCRNIQCPTVLKLHTWTRNEIILNTYYLVFDNPRIKGSGPFYICSLPSNRTFLSVSDLTWFLALASFTSSHIFAFSSSFIPFLMKMLLSLDYKMRVFAKFQASKSKGCLIHRE